MKLIASNSQQKVAQDIVDERMRQDAKWGVQNHDLFIYLSILMEEVGELSECALHSKFGGEKYGYIRVEAVQVAAVAMAIIERIDRGNFMVSE